MKSSCRAMMVSLFLALAVSPVFAQAANQTPRSQSPKQKQGLLDFALKRINPSDRDYGQCIDEGRRLLLEETVGRAYFWSNLVVLGLLGGFFIVIVHQHRVQQRRECIVTEALAQYQHALARAEAQLSDANRRNHAFVEAFTTIDEIKIETEPAQQRAKATLVVASKDAGQNAAVKPNAVLTSPSGTRAQDARAGDKPGTDASKPGMTVSVNPQSQSAPVHPVKGNADVDLVAKINLLQGQLSGSQEREKQMRRQLNDAELRLQKEQQKNRNLKGE
jgi:hypothetical protein